MTNTDSKLIRIYEPFMHTFMKMMYGMAGILSLGIIAIIYEAIQKQTWQPLLIVPFFGFIATMMFRMYGPLRRVYATNAMVQIRLSGEPLEIPLTELQSIDRPMWAPISSMGIGVVELKFSRQTPRILLACRNTDLDTFKNLWQASKDSK